jgi:hypothetical protein
MSNLTVQHIVDAITVLNDLWNSDFDVATTEQARRLGDLKGRAIGAAIALKVYSHIDKIKLDIKPE